MQRKNLYPLSPDSEGLNHGREGGQGQPIAKINIPTVRSRIVIKAAVFLW